ncbi:hypothetical protein GCM10009841_03400 [Microlunatus panaciterrae]|uniref:Mannosyltransferase (PIG-V) n=1 Tax=Microlunatus panaciterrae TaxID=400768 RepID=A0ABS2RJ29_9ACTN|nr:hypothetical protein [Microlunatus panaciterrae]MBM7798999.1 hypothetical protein [Microlunatus panaciterrae]
MSARVRRRTSDPRSGRMVAQAWLASRGLIVLMALLLALLRHADPFELANHWDALHYGALAEKGYLDDPKRMAFFPGLPALLALGLWLKVPYVVTGVMLALVGSALAAAALNRLAGPWGAIAWLFAPTAVFTTVPYTESLFCAAAFWAWERAHAGRWLPAVVLTALACTLRVSGLFLIGALFVMILTTPRTSWSARLRRSALLLIPAAVLFGYIGYLYSLTGSWTAWFTAQSTGWVRGFTWPWDSFAHTIPAMQIDMYPDRPEVHWVFRGEMVSMALGLVVTLWCLTRRMWAEASWVGVQVLAFSLSYWFFSVNRAILLWFPLWMMLAQWGTWQPRWRWLRVTHRVVVVLLFAASIGLMLVWCWLFFTQRWAS